MKQINHTLKGYHQLNSIVFLAIFIVFLGVYFENAYADEIILSPEQNTFGPNDSISIFVEIDGYIGGNVAWTAQKPDGSTESGELTSLKGGKKLHTFNRNAFDNQFGIWQLEYSYKNLSKTISITVEPISLEIKSDKGIFYPGEMASFRIITNYFEPNAAIAEILTVSIQDKNDVPAKHIDAVEQKAFQSSTLYNLDIENLIQNNPFGDYKVVVQYYNTFSEFSFSVKESSLTSSVFIGTDKPVYDFGDKVEVQLIISDVTDSTAVITITNPEGKKTQKNVIISGSLTRLLLDDVPTNLPGTYLIEVEYSGFVDTKTFAVNFETVNESEPGIDLRVSLDKQQYAPGEVITAGVKTNVLLADNIEYWVVDPTGNSSPKLSRSMTSGNALIPYHVSPDSHLGPWKFYVNYGGAERFSIFFMAGESSEQIVVEETNISQRKLLMTIDGTQNGLNKPHGIALDSENAIFVASSGNSEIKKFDSTGNLLTSWGEFGSEEGQFIEPTGIFVDSNYVHVADTGNSRIQTFDKDGNFIRSWGNSGIESQSLQQPVSISQDSLGIFYISDQRLGKIPKYDSDGKYVGHIESLQTAAAKFVSSDYIVTGKNNHNLILVSPDNRILEYDYENKFKNFLGSVGNDDGKFQDPSVLAIDTQGYLYVGDSGNFRVQVFDPEKKFFTKWGSLGTGEGQFNKISGIALDTKGNIFVVDSTNNKIQKFSSLFATEELDIPDWVRSNAKWWYEGSIEDSEFANGIQFMINNEIIIIPDLGESGESESEKEIPEWVKNNAQWWSEGQISDEDFANGIEYLVANGIIQV